MALKLSGNNATAYYGVEPSQPPQLLIVDRLPTSNDTNYNVGTFWLYNTPVTEQLWQLVNKPNGVASWIQLYPFDNDGGAFSFPCNVGIANSNDGTLEIIGISDARGNTGFRTVGAGDTVSIETTQTTFISDSGNAFPTNDELEIVGSTLVTTDSVLNEVRILGDSAIGSNFLADTGSAVPVLNQLAVRGTNVMTSTGSSDTITYGLTEGTNGQVIIGATGAAPAWSNLTSSDSSITITEGANSIDLTLTTPPPPPVDSFVGFCTYVSTTRVLGPLISPYSGSAPVVKGGGLLFQFDSILYNTAGAALAPNQVQFISPSDGYWKMTVQLTYGTQIANNAQPLAWQLFIVYQSPPVTSKTSWVSTMIKPTLFWTDPYETIGTTQQIKGEVQLFVKAGGGAVYGGLVPYMTGGILPSVKCTLIGSDYTFSNFPKTGAAFPDADTILYTYLQAEFLGQ